MRTHDVGNGCGDERISQPAPKSGIRTDGSGSGRMAFNTVGDVRYRRARGKPRVRKGRSSRPTTGGKRLRPPWLVVRVEGDALGLVAGLD
jgi:hypothetical protein